MADDDDKGKGPEGGKGPASDAKDGQGEGGIEATVRRILAELLPKGGGRGQAAEHDVTAQVEAAVAKVHQGKEAERVMAEIQDRLKKIEERPVMEKKPKEYRRITTRIWGTDDDD